MFLKPKEFAEAIGIKYGTLRQDILKSKVVKSGKLIDTEYAPNVEYIKQRTDGNGLNYSKISQATRNAPIQAKVEKAEVQNGKAPSIEKPVHKKVRHSSYSLRKQKADAEKAEKDVELKQMEIAKKSGELLPVDLVEKILTINIQHVFRSMDSEIENIAALYCDLLGGGRTHHAEITVQLREKLAQVVSTSKTRSLEDVKAAIKTYAEVRSRGERK